CDARSEENDEVKARKKMLKAQKEAGGGGGGGGALGSRRRWNRKLDLGRSTRRRRTTTPSTRSPSPAPSNTGLTPAAYDWSVKSPSEPCAAPPAAQTRQPYFDYPAAAAMLPTPQEEASAHVFSPPMGSPYDERPTYVAPAFAACPLTPPEEHFVPTSRSIACPPIQEVYSQRPTLVHYNSAPFVQQTAPFAVQSAMMPLMVERSWALQQSRHASIHTLVSPDPSAPPSPTVPRGLSLPETTPLVAPIPTRPPQNCEFLTHHPTPRNSWDGTAAAYAVRPPRDEILAPAPVPSWDAVLADDEVDSSACYTESWVDTQNRQPLADYFSKYQQVCLLWDSTVLYGLTAPISEETIEAVENYYLTWWNGGMAVKSFMHIVMVVLFLSLIAKWARKGSETAYYFSGASIVALVVCAALYITVTLPSIRHIAKDPFNKSALILPGEDFFTRMQQWLADRNSGTLGNRARENMKLLANIEPMDWMQRVQHVQVMSAANTIIAVLLVGVVVLQVSEWYVEDTIVREAEEEARKQQAAAPVTVEKKKQ
ncbi:Proteophosphoglycan ppg4, partial [Rhodotorula toruloides]